MISESDILAQLGRGYEFPPVEFRLRAAEPRPEVDALLEINALGRTLSFDTVVKSRSTPRAFEEVLLRVEQWTSKQGRFPLVVVPYLRESQLAELIRRGISGIDMSGNGVVLVDDKLFIYRTGSPNRYPDSLPTKYAYRGATSLVARVFLCRSQYTSLADIEQEIERRGGKVVKSTISKALKRLEEDVVIGREPNRIWLRQADKLLDLLAQSFTSPKVTRRVPLKIKGSGLADRARTATAVEAKWEELVRRAVASVSWTFSGRASLERYAVLGRKELPQLYCSDTPALVESWQGLVDETERFNDFELLESDDPTLYFDRRATASGVFASPVQAFLECSQGDKREQEAAGDIRQLILREIERGGGDI